MISQLIQRQRRLLRNRLVKKLSNQTSFELKLRLSDRLSQKQTRRARHKLRALQQWLRRWNRYKQFHKQQHKHQFIKNHVKCVVGIILIIDSHIIVWIEVAVMEKRSILSIYNAVMGSLNQYFQNANSKVWFGKLVFMIYPGWTLPLGEYRGQGYEGMIHTVFMKAEPLSSLGARASLLLIGYQKWRNLIRKCIN